MILLTIIINSYFNGMYHNELEVFGESFTVNPNILLKASDEQLLKYCSIQIDDIAFVEGVLDIFNALMVCYSLCMFTSAIQQITISKIKDNASINFNAVAIEFAGGVLGLMFIICKSQAAPVTLIAKKCNSVMELTSEQLD